MNLIPGSSHRKVKSRARRAVAHLEPAAAVRAEQAASVVARGWEEAAPSG